MIVFPPDELKALADRAEAAYPLEACGLIVGRREGEAREAWTWRVARLEPSPNLADEPRHRFEVDPALRLRLQRQLRGGPDQVIGLYHSHPDGAAQPSATDLAAAWEPYLVWVIAAVTAGQACHVAAHLLAADGTRFREIPLRTTAWTDDPVRAPYHGEGLP